ncbi:hypothetical protein A8990_14722 [Paenibacillus taihuensis]|uniref:Uncharacterized protein n=1 Tax=Paenibacillus taihuensis TaxID=1156355 RepID=A0A3D9QTU1_9BACL|nr:hypothetical protein [Paenibacillus taihuensis]REE66723.1 hypothetical protein A8990_14722 [Paenibacillus taihuensis]
MTSNDFDPNDRSRSRNRIVKQEKRLILLCIGVAVIMLLSLSRYVFE